MARTSRRAETGIAEDNDSQKENSMPPSSQVKQEKVKKEKARAERDTKTARDEDAEDEQDDENKRPRTTQATDAPDEDDEDAEDELADGEEGAGSPKGRKRARVSENGDASTSKGKGRARPVTLPRCEDGYIPGSIVRVQLKNFVTYDFVEFHPGPYLNMIFGPNGTGKSSIACALCLGLNFPPSVLGRATEIQSFVKNGTQEGHIEIELRGPPNKKNLVIRRYLKAGSRSSTFTLNGQPATGKEVTTRIAELNIQVGNLCSFLPQDRVSEFARMTPPQLLRETQRAAGDERLTQWHDTLIESGKEYKVLTEALQTEKDSLKTMEQRNENLEGEVERFHKRQEIERNIKILQLLLPFVQYLEAKNVYDEAKVVQRALHEKCLKLEAKNAPAHKLAKELENEYAKHNRDRESKKTLVQKRFRDMKAKWTESESLGDAAEAIQTELAGLKKEEKDRRTKIQQLEKTIQKIQERLDNPPAMEDVDALNEELKAVQNKHNEVKFRLDEFQGRQRAIAEETGRHQAERNAALQGLQNLDNQAHMKLEMLARWNRDTADAVRWLRDNHDKFKMEVFEPPYMNVTVPDKSFVAAVESNFDTNAMQTFVCQCEEDMRTLNHWVNDTQDALGRRARINVWYRPKDERTLIPPPMTEEQMRQIGFDCYALDKIVCPDGMLWFLKKQLNMHRLAIAIDARHVDPNAAMLAVANGPGNGASYIIGQVMNQVARSRYGRRAAQNNTRQIRKPQSLVATPVDLSAKKGFQERLNAVQLALEEIEEKAADLTKEERAIRTEGSTIQKEAEAIRKRRDAALDVQRQMKKLMFDREKHEDRVNQLRNAPSLDDKRAELRKKLLRLTRNRTRLVKDYIALVRLASADQMEATRVGLDYLQIGANKAALDRHIAEKDKEHTQAMAAFNEADRVYQEAKIDSKEKLDKSKKKLAAADEDIRDEFHQFESKAKEKTTEDVEDELANQQAELELAGAINPAVVEQFEKRKRDIESLTKSIEQKEKKAIKIERNIQNAKDNWQPALEKLVGRIGEKFSAAFDRIGCAGEIKISPDEDFSKWAIDILVKFRDNEKLQLLTAHRQSGGERSLTTILYLLSLTEEARAPFSLVDEINQGMDRRNEKMVHDQMVEVTCRPDAAQYFLITPKLLSGLHYHKLMKILCVNNGEWLPEAQGLGNMMNLVQAHAARQGRSNGSA